MFITKEQWLYVDLFEQASGEYIKSTGASSECLLQWKKRNSSRCEIVKVSDYFQV